MSKEYRCRKCRHTLFTIDSLITCHNEKIAELPGNSDEIPNNECYRKSSSIMFIDDQCLKDDEKYGSWIKQQIDDGEWLKGRLICPIDKCKSRIGCFNFINTEFCHCGQYQLPSIQLNRSKIDIP